MVTVRLLGESWSARLDALLGDMDLHYFQDSGPGDLWTLLNFWQWSLTLSHQPLS